MYQNLFNLPYIQSCDKTIYVLCLISKLIVRLDKIREKRLNKS